MKKYGIAFFSKIFHTQLTEQPFRKGVAFTAANVAKEDIYFWFDKKWDEHTYTCYIAYPKVNYQNDVYYDSKETGLTLASESMEELATKVARIHGFV